MFKNKSVDRTPHQQVAFLQNSANGLSDMRSDTAPMIAKHILDNPNYHSWGLAGFVLSTHLTDKVDGKLAGMRKVIMERLASIGQPVTDEKVLRAIAEGGGKDQEADKSVNHSVFGAVAVREALNGNFAYSGLVGGADAAMFARDRYVNKKRDEAAGNGVNGDARQLGKWKQALLVAVQVVAVSPFARPKKSGEGLHVGRTVTAIGMLGGTAMSLYSGWDQLRSLRHGHSRHQAEKIFQHSVEQTVSQNHELPPSIERPVYVDPALLKPVAVPLSHNANGNAAHEVQPIKPQVQDDISAAVSRALSIGQ